MRAHARAHALKSPDYYIPLSCFWSGVFDHSNKNETRRQVCCLCEQVCSPACEGVLQGLSGDFPSPFASYFLETGSACESGAGWGPAGPGELPLPCAVLGLCHRRAFTGLLGSVWLFVCGFWDLSSYLILIQQALSPGGPTPQPLSEPFKTPLLKWRFLSLSSSITN